MIGIESLQKVEKSLDRSRWYHDVNWMIEASGFGPEVVNAALFIVKLCDGVE